MIIQTIEEQISQVTSANLLYTEYYSRWKYLLASYLGGDEYRVGAYLTRYQLETPAEYQARLISTPLENHCASVISVYNSFLFRTEPTREYGSIEYAPELADFIADTDFDGRDLDSFFKEVSQWSAVFGHAWIIVAKANVGATTRADELSQGVRPYLSLITPLMVLDWTYSRDRTGRLELTYLKYLEEINDTVRTVKEWYPDRVKTTQVNLRDRTITFEFTEENQLGYIPAVCAYHRRSTVRGIGISAISDIADAQRFIYNNTSEVEQSIRLDSHPSLVKTPETQAGSGAGSIIHMPDNLDGTLKPYLLEYSGGEIKSIYESINHMIGAIDKMANTGAVRASESRTMSGVAMETEFQLLNARLSEMADNLELAEEQMWKIWADYQGYTWDGEIDYPGSFNIRDTGAEVAQLVQARGAATDPVVLRKIDEHLLEWMDEDYVDLPFIDPNPQPGRTYADGEAIADSLPAAYQLATNAEVPPGQNCGNCAYYKPGELYCTKFDAPVRAVYWCAKWESYEEVSMMTAEIMVQIQEMIMNGMTNDEIMNQLPGITVDDIALAAANAARDNN